MVKNITYIALFCYAQLFSTAAIAQLPIKASRTICISTTEGSYMDVDISPDGKTLVFDLLGDLFTVPVTGGNATQLTRGLALNTRPIWSSDGSLIIYLSDSSGAFHYHIRDISGKIHTVLKKDEKHFPYSFFFEPQYHDPVWTSDSKYIALDTALFGIDGKWNEIKTSIPHPLRFSTDGKWIYYISRQSLLKKDLKTGGNEIVMNSISKGAGTFWLNGIISPNGNYWCYVYKDTTSTDHLMVHDIAKGTEKELLTNFITESPKGTDKTVPHFSFSPDSKSIFISHKGKIHQIFVRDGLDKIIPFVANIKCDLSSFKYHSKNISQSPFLVKYVRWANASPDGKRLTFSALNKVYIMDLPNGKPHVLVNQPCAQFQPVFSPDGRSIAYVSWNDTIGGQLWTVGITHNKVKQLSSIPGLYSTPTWSYDSKRIAVIYTEPNLRRLSESKGNLEVFDIANNKKQLIDSLLPSNNSISFDITGKKITYRPIDTGSTTPYLITKDLNSVGFKVLIAASGNSLDPLTGITISPDGHSVIYNKGDKLFLACLNPALDLNTFYGKKKNLMTIHFARGLDPRWELDGKYLTWCYSNKFYRTSTSKIFDNALVDATKQHHKEDVGYLTAIVKPDKIVAITLKSEYEHSKGLIALTNCRIITAKKKGVINSGVILIRDGRIVRVGSNFSINIPMDAKRYNLTGKTIMPGLIDLHLHLYRPGDVISQQAPSLMANLAYGITTARDPSQTTASYGMQELINGGQMLGPRLFSSGTSIGQFKDDQATSLNNVTEVIRGKKILGGAFIKNYLLDTRIQRQWTILAADQNKMNQTNEGSTNTLMQIGMIKDGSAGIEHNPIWGDVYNDVVQLYARSQVFLTPTLQVAYGDKFSARDYLIPHFWQPIPNKLSRFSDDYSLTYFKQARTTKYTLPGFTYMSRIDARIRHAGGRVTVGGHGNDEGPGTHNEIWALQMGGLTNMEALQAGTIMAAQALGAQKDIGSIEVGKIADLVILNSNPLDDIHNTRDIKYVMKDGILYDGDTLDQLWPVYKKCPEWRMKTTNTSTPNTKK